MSPGGCSGLAAEFSVESVAASPAKPWSKHNGLKLFLPAESRLLLDGVTIDFADTPTESGLVFRDPKSTGSACGTHASKPAELVSLSTFRREE